MELAAFGVQSLTMKPNFETPRRRFLQSFIAAGALASTPQNTLAKSRIADLPPGFNALKPLGERVHPIQPQEFRGRVQHAQELMSTVDPKIDALVIGPGTSLYYFTGIHWYLSERLLAFLLPRQGQPVLISPAFEEGRVRESMRYPIDIRVWQEDESPTQRIVRSLVDGGTRTGRIGIEETLPFTFYDRLRADGPSYEFVSADPVTIGCRARKSENELALMRLACEATCDVYRAVFASLREGMSQQEIARLVSDGFEKMNLRGEALVLIGPSAALPHGSKQPQTLKEGNVILIDGECTVDDYYSDVSRTGVLGKPSSKLQQVFETVRKAQDAALDAARAGKLSGSVDDAARAVITSAGFGPDYKFFVHRLGHGIGLNEHEHPYLVRGSKTILAQGMTFSNEPGIYVPGEFGIRCEDDMAIASQGPAQLLTPGFQSSLEKPLG